MCMYNILIVQMCFCVCVSERVRVRVLMHAVLQIGLDVQNAECMGHFDVGQEVGICEVFVEVCGYLLESASE